MTPFVLECVDVCAPPSVTQGEREPHPKRQVNPHVRELPAERKVTARHWKPPQQPLAA